MIRKEEYVSNILRQSVIKANKTLINGAKLLSTKKFLFPRLIYLEDSIVNEDMLNKMVDINEVKGGKIND